MRTNIPEKMLKIADDISEHGNVNLTRLVALKKWFEKPERLAAFAVWVAARATSRKGKTIGTAAELFRESKALLAGADKCRPQLDRQKAEVLHDRLRDFQNEYENQRWGSGAHRSQLESHAGRIRPGHSSSAHEFSGGRLQAGRKLLPELRPAIWKRFERPEPDENRGDGPVHVHHRSLGGSTGMKPAFAD